MTGPLCGRCDGSGEVTYNHQQDYWGNWDCDYGRCPDCDGTGLLPVLADGLTDQQYAALELIETTAPTIPPLPPVTQWECSLRSCNQITSNPSRYCDDCHRDAAADHESQRAS